jgi:hypothetical protein
MNWTASGVQVTRTELATTPASVSPTMKAPDAMAFADMA